MIHSIVHTVAIQMVSTPLHVLVCFVGDFYGPFARCKMSLALFQKLTCMSNVQSGKAAFQIWRSLYHRKHINKLSMVYRRPDYMCIYMYSMLHVLTYIQYNAKTLFPTGVQKWKKKIKKYFFVVKVQMCIISAYQHQRHVHWCLE